MRELLEGTTERRADWYLGQRRAGLKRMIHRPLPVWDHPCGDSSFSSVEDNLLANAIYVLRFSNRKQDARDTQVHFCPIDAEGPL